MSETLFPTNETTATPSTAAPEVVSFGKSWRFDFDAGEFVLTPSGRVLGCEDADAWLEWCMKAVATTRYKYLVYSRNYGQEFDDLISRHLSRSANESEIQRIATECLMVDPRTEAVKNFAFTWEGDQCFFTCEVTNVRGEHGTLLGKVMI